MELKDQIYAIAIPLIKQFEKCKLFEYLDSAGYPTIGWGMRISHGQFPHGITQAQADRMFMSALDSRYEYMMQLIHVPLTPNQYAACLSLVYNIGFGSLHPFTDWFLTSHLLTLINCECFKQAALEFVRWCHAGGKEEPGLKRRRMCEALIFNGRTIADLIAMNWLE